MQVQTQQARRTVMPPTVIKSREKIKLVKELPELTRAEHIGLMIRPHQAMISIVNGTGTNHDWQTVTFRIMAAQEIAEKCYCRKTYDELQEVVDVMLAMRVRAKGTNTYQFRNHGERQDVSQVLRLMDDFQVQETRVTIHYCFRRAQDRMLKYK